MRIGIDISQLAYPKTGVASYLEQLVHHLIEKDKQNEYILFYSSLRKKLHISFTGTNVLVKTFKFPPSFLDILWNRLHIIPIEWLVGPIDVFISSDWTQPPSKAKKATILYDLIVLKYPQETDKKIIEAQKRKLFWVKKEVDKVLCISRSTQEDAAKLLGIAETKLAVIYPGV